MTLKVRLTLEAKRQIAAISAYISQDSPANARRWRHVIRDRLRSLSDFHGHEIAYRVDQVGRDVRRTFMGAYQVLYAIDENAVIVLTVRHGARKPLSFDEVKRLS